MKTNGLRGFIYKAILLILLSLYFLLVFSRTPDAGSKWVSSELSTMHDTPLSLPKLLSFEGIASNKQVRLNWKFETTEGLDECVLERADKTGEFKPVAYFFMTEDIHMPSLRYTDTVPKNQTYSYRLRLTGKEGASQCTKALIFKVTSKGDQKETLEYPSIIL